MQELARCVFSAQFYSKEDYWFLNDSMISTTENKQISKCLFMALSILGLFCSFILQYSIVTYSHVQSHIITSVRFNTGTINEKICVGKVIPSMYDAFSYISIIVHPKGLYIIEQYNNLTLSKPEVYCFIALWGRKSQIL